MSETRESLEAQEDAAIPAGGIVSHKVEGEDPKLRLTSDLHYGPCVLLLTHNNIKHMHYTHIKKKDKMHVVYRAGFRSHRRTEIRQVQPA